jgi:S-adenosylmethionine-diacylgycerolhomoserine-N-methlytransferase
MAFLNDLKILYHLALRPVRGKNHAQRMEDFYSGQATNYDDFRKRLLQGREEVYESLGHGGGEVWVDFGGGTGANLECIGEPIRGFEKIYVVDLATSLLEVVRNRSNKHGWTNVEAVTADATQWTPPEGSADVVTFSYSLTMIPDWFAAIDNALRILKPGGRIGVIDFYVARKYPSEAMIRHGWTTRTFWPMWFANDNVFPNPDHLPYLQRHFDTQFLREKKAKVPYLPLVRTPYYQFIGQKRAG